MTEPIAARPLSQALSFQGEGAALSAQVDGDYSNGPHNQPPEKGFPFGGLLAALASAAMRQGLGIEAPLRTLTVQFLAAARFGRLVQFRPRLLRGGRTVAYTAVEAGQGERTTLAAMATWGEDAETVALAPLRAPPPPREGLDPTRQLPRPYSPYFTDHVDYLYAGGPLIMGGNVGKAAVERVWMRTRDKPVLDADRLCFLLDALYPPAWTAFQRPPMMTSVDLRYDILNDPTPELCPDGWAFFEFRMLDIGGGWTLDDCTCWAEDGTPLAVARQRRKLI